VASTPSG